MTSQNTGVVVKHMFRATLVTLDIVRTTMEKARGELETLGAFTKGLQ